MNCLSRLLFALLFSATTVTAQEPDEPREGGLTGTGILGLVSAEGRVEINDLVFTLPDTVTVASPLGDSAVQDLQPGDMVALQLGGDRQDMSVIEARQVIQMIGPISAVKDVSYTVLGTTITRPASSYAGIGEWIAVSGYWREDGIVASRVKVLPPQQAIYMQGTYQPTASGVGKIGNTLIRGVLPSVHKPGTVIRVNGQASDDVLIANTFAVGQFAAPVRFVLAQGYLSEPDATGHYTVLGAGISSITTQPEMIDQHDFVTACGVDGDLLPDDVDLEGEEYVANAMIALNCLER